MLATNGYTTWQPGDGVAACGPDGSDQFGTEYAITPGLRQALDHAVIDAEILFADLGNLLPLRGVEIRALQDRARLVGSGVRINAPFRTERSEEHTSELQSLRHLVCRLLLEKKKR